MSGAQITHIGLCGNPRKDELLPAVATLRAICRARGVQVLLHQDLADQLGEGPAGLDDAALVEHSGLIVALGGDGTMLAAARMIGESGRSLLGINLGSLGYLTDIPVSGLDVALRRVLAGDYVVVGRSRVHCTVWRDGAVYAEALGLNDVVVNMGPLPRSLDLELRLGGTSPGALAGRRGHLRHGGRFDGLQPECRRDHLRSGRAGLAGHPHLPAQPGGQAPHPER